MLYLSRKLTKSIVFLIAVLLFSSLGCINFVKAQNSPNYPINVNLLDPADGATFNGGVVFQVYIPQWLNSQSEPGVEVYDVHATILLDGFIYGTPNQPVFFYYQSQEYLLFAYLTNLTNGEHKIQVIGNAVVVIDEGVLAPNGMSYYPINITEAFNSPINSFSVNATKTTQTSQVTGSPFSNWAMILSGVIAGVIIVSITLLVIYRKQNLKAKDKLTTA